MLIGSCSSRKLLCLSRGEGASKLGAASSCLLSASRLRPKARFASTCISGTSAGELPCGRPSVHGAQRRRHEHPRRQQQVEAGRRRGRLRPSRLCASHTSPWGSKQICKWLLPRTAGRALAECCHCRALPREAASRQPGRWQCSVQQLQCAGAGRSTMRPCIWVPPLPLINNCAE